MKNPAEIVHSTAAPKPPANAPPAKNAMEHTSLNIWPIAFTPRMIGRGARSLRGADVSLRSSGGGSPVGADH
jgi:hypothetical protein